MVIEDFLRLSAREISRIRCVCLFYTDICTYAVCSCILTSSSLIAFALSGFFFSILFVLCSFICSSHSNKKISNKQYIKVNSLLYKPALNLTVRTESMGFFIFSLIHYYNHYFLYDLDQSIGI